MRILFITQWFHPEPSFKTLAFARELIKLGHRVEVLTGLPNYPHGNIYDGYKVRLLQRENMGGVRVTRVPLYPSHDRSGVRRFLNYTSFALSATLVGPWVISGADVAYVYHPPATIYLPACMIRLLRRIPIVYDVQDLWPDTLKATGMFNSKLGLGLMSAWCKFIYKSADKIVVLSPGFKNTLHERGVPPDKIEVVYNWCDDTVIRPMEPDSDLLLKLGLKNKFTIMFAGNMGRAQALDTILSAAEIVAGRCPQVQFVFVGDGIEKGRIRRKAGEMGLKNVSFFPSLPQAEIAAVLSLADVLLVHLKDDPLFRITIPSKIQAYLAVGRPILAGVRGDAAELVTKARAGAVCPPEDAYGIAEQVCKLQAMPRARLNDIGSNGRRFYQKELSLKIATERFQAIFKSVAKGSSLTE